MGIYINFNGALLPEDEPIFKSSSRVARFGDGVFETMRMNNGQLLFSEQHASRLFSGLEVLRFKLPKHFTWEFLEEEIAKIAKKNDCAECARIRLMISRGDGGITEEPVNSPQFLIETWPTEIYSFDQGGISLGIFDQAKKSIDAFSNIKSCNFLPYVLSMQFAKQHHFDECLLLNSEQRICDASISNLFWIRGSGICTTPLSEGPVGGVMRSYLLKSLPMNGYTVEEEHCTIDELLNSDEIFLTNVIRGIRPVKSFQNRKFGNTVTSKIFEEIISPLTK